MAGITSHLYPPIVNTYIPAFVINASGKTTCYIYFSLSAYNSLADIENVQVTICNQKTNATVLDKNKYPSGIMLCSIAEDKTRTSNDKYYIEITNLDLDYGFQINQYYKVQLRFTSKEAPRPDSETALDSWFAANTAYFSEWSTICLVRGISQPVLELLNFDESDNTSMTVTQSTLSLVGTLSFEDETEKETLKSYRTKLYGIDKTLVESYILIHIIMLMKLIMYLIIC